MDQGSISPCELTIEQTQEIFLRPVRLIKILKYFITLQENKKIYIFFADIYFGSNEKLETHTVDCEQMNDCAITFLA